jgi:putative transposase
MKRSSLAEEQIMGMLREQQGGQAAGDICQHTNSSAAFYKWKAKYCGLDLAKARRLNPPVAVRACAEPAC